MTATMKLPPIALRGERERGGRDDIVFHARAQTPLAPEDQLWPTRRPRLHSVVEGSRNQRAYALSARGEK